MRKMVHSLSGHNVKRFILLLFLTVMNISVFSLCAPGKIMKSGMYEYELSGKNSVRITKYNGYGPNVVIPKKLGGKNVEYIGESAFEGNTKIRKVTIQSHISSVGAYAFAGCTSLVKVVFNVSGNTVSNGTFSRCTALKTVCLSDKIEFILNSAFHDCTSLKNLTIGTSESALSSIWSGAFSNCSQTINVTYAGKKAWWKVLKRGSELQKLKTKTTYSTKNLPTFSAPKNLKVKYLTTATVKLTWDPVPGARNYMIYQKDADGQWSSFVCTGSEYGYHKGKEISLSSYKTVFRVAAMGENRQEKPLVGPKSSITVKSLSLVTLNWPSVSGRKVNLSWNRDLGASGYVLNYYFWNSDDKNSASKTYTKYIKSGKTVKTQLTVPEKYNYVDVTIRPYLVYQKKKVMDPLEELDWKQVYVSNY